MLSSADKFLKYSKLIFIFIFLIYLVWWVYLNFITTIDANPNLYNYFTDSYGLIALFGGIVGLYAADRWGGFKSVVGKALIFFSIGLIFQFLGQLCYAIYYYVYHIDNPYPSFGEVFYFGSIPVYLLAVWFLAKAMGFKYALKSRVNKFIAVIVPLLLVFSSYYVFLGNYEIYTESLLTTFLDVGYPLGQAGFISLAIVAFVSSKSLLGGKLRIDVLFILFSLLVQYFADSMFLYQTIQETWTPAGLNDMIFLISYLLMAWALAKFGDAASKFA